MKQLPQPLDDAVAHVEMFGGQVMLPEPYQASSTIARLTTQLAAANAEIERLRWELDEYRTLYGEVLFAQQCPKCKGRCLSLVGHAFISDIGRSWNCDECKHRWPTNIQDWQEEHDAELAALRTAHEADRAAMREAKDAIEKVAGLLKNARLPESVRWLNERCSQPADGRIEYARRDVSAALAALAARLDK